MSDTPSSGYTDLVIDSTDKYPPIETIDPKYHELYRRNVRLHDELLKVLYDEQGRPRKIAHDFWGNLASVRSAKEFRFSREPTIHCMDILGLDGKVDVNEFVNVSQTILHLSSRQYLENLGKAFGVLEVTEQMHEDFEYLERSEHGRLSGFTDVRKKLRRLSKRHVQALVTNTPWTSTLNKFLKDEELDLLLQHKIVSSVIGVSKQDGELIYMLTAIELNCEPHEIVMIGNDLLLDIIPPLKIGYKVILCDREFKYVDKDGNWRKFEIAGDFAKRKVKYVNSLGREVTATLGRLPESRLKELTYGDLLVEYLTPEGQLVEVRLADVGFPVINSYEPIPAPPES